MKFKSYDSNKLPILFCGRNSSVKLTTYLIIKSYLNSLRSSRLLSNLINRINPSLYLQLRYFIIILYINIKNVIFELLFYNISLFELSMLTICIWENLILKSVEDLVFQRFNISTNNSYNAKIISNKVQSISFEQKLLIEKALGDIYHPLYSSRLAANQRSRFDSFTKMMKITTYLIMYSNNLLLKTLLITNIRPCTRLNYDTKALLNFNNYYISNSILEINKIFLLEYFNEFYLKYLNDKYYNIMIIIQINNSIVIRSKIIYSTRFKALNNNYFNISFFKIYKILCKKLQLATLIVGKLTMYLIFNKIYKKIRYLK